MKTTSWTLLSGLVCASIATPAPAYELATHGAITYEASKRSVLNDQQFLKDLGIDTQTNLNDPFGTVYYDVSGATVQPRASDTFEDTIIQRLGLQPLSLPAWLMRGAIREDDVRWPFGDNPQDDPYGNKMRVLNHFFDPYNNIPLTVAGIAAGAKAPDWAAGTPDIFTAPNTPDTGRDNHFTIFDAREAMYRALTGKKKDGTNAAPGATDNNPALEYVRKAYWATTFRALGDVMHLVEDMAQPQHTRNDAHSGMPGFGHKSVYELFVECRATQSGVTDLGSYNIKDCPGLTPADYAGYPDVVFTKYSDYFSTHNGREWGLADYSNNGFFSAGTNLGRNSYPYPSNDPSRYSERDTVVDSSGSVTSHLIGTVPDSLYPELTATAALATKSLWYEFLIESGKQEYLGYTLDVTNYVDMSNLLIPRAVAYSAGLLNHFFRGKLAITAPDEGIYAILDHATRKAKDTEGFTLVKLKVKNTTPDIAAPGGTFPQDMKNGELVAVAKFKRNTCYQPELDGEFKDAASTWNGCIVKTYRSAEEIVVSQKITGVSLPADPASKPVQYSFTFDKPIPVNATDLYIQVVYRGALGDESDAVVVATKDLREPTFVDYTNGMDYSYIKDFTTGTSQWYNNLTQRETIQGLIDNDKTAFFRTWAPRLTTYRKMQLKFGSSTKVAAVVPEIPAPGYMRIAVLMDVDWLRLGYTTRITNYYLDASGTKKQGDAYDWSGSFDFHAKINQNNDVSIVRNVRGGYYWWGRYVTSAYPLDNVPTQQVINDAVANNVMPPMDSSTLKPTTICMVGDNQTPPEGCP